MESKRVGDEEASQVAASPVEVPTESLAADEKSFWIEEEGRSGSAGGGLHPRSAIAPT